MKKLNRILNGIILFSSKKITIKQNCCLFLNFHTTIIDDKSRQQEKKTTTVTLSITPKYTICFTSNIFIELEKKKRRRRKMSSSIPLAPNSFRHLQEPHSIFSDASGSKSSCSRNRCNQISFDLIRSISFG